MGLYRIQQAGHNRPAQPRAVQNGKAGVCCGGVHQGAAGYRIRPAEGGVGAEQLGAAVRLSGMGIHNAARQLDELAHMADQQHLLKLLRCRHIQRITDEV